MPCARLCTKQVLRLRRSATSTPVGDRGKLAAIRFVFGKHNGPIISAIKPATGYLLGAAGGIKAIFTALALYDQVAPRTLNLNNPDPLSTGLDLIASQARPASFDYAISNGFGFGGVNVSVILRCGHL